MLRAEREKLIKALANFDEIVEAVKLHELDRRGLLKSTNEVYRLLNDVIQNAKVDDALPSI